MKNFYAATSVASFCLFLGITLTPGLAVAQHYYPAGLGNSNLQLWLTAADPTTILTSAGTQAANGNSVATWKDKSGNGFNAVQATSGSQPVYQTNQLNGFGGIIFQNTNQYMTGPSGAYQTVVSTRAMLGTSYQYLFSSPALSDFSVRFHGGTSTVQYTDGPNGNDWDYNTGATSAQWINGTQSLNGSTATHILVDQAQAATNATYSISSTFLSRGMYNNDPVYDLLVYNQTLNTTQRRLLENYEAALWGLSSNLPTTGGYFRYVPPTATTFNKNLIGIGYASSTDNFLTDVAGSTDGLGFSSGTTASDFLGSAGFLMAAHNGQTNSVLFNQTLSNVPVNSYIWNRSWYVQHSGGNSSGNVTLAFNFSDFNGTTPNGSYTFALLFNPTNSTYSSGTNTRVNTVSYSISGNTVSFVVSAANLSTGYYTIIYNQNNVLPVTLESFTVGKESADAALVKWTMGPGFGQGSFTVQRSADGVQFSTIATVDGVANDGSDESYSYADNLPAAGVNYYRLTMTDAEGNVSYSPVGSVAFNSASRSITLYPVPATDALHISAPGISGGASVAVYSVSGQLVGNYQLSMVDGASLPIGKLPGGSYFIQIKMAGQSTALSFLKR